MDSQKQAEVSHTVAHYLLVIHKLIEEMGYARVTDISKSLGVSKGSASTTLSSLKARGLIAEAENSKFLILTAEGHEEVHRILSSRTLLYFFFHEILNVDKDTALQNACSIEHLISGKVRNQLFEFMKTLSLPDSNPEKKSLIQKFEAYDSKLNLKAFASLENFIESQHSDFENLENSQ